MINQDNSETTDIAEAQFFRTLKETGDFEIAPCDSVVDVDNKQGLTKLKLSSAQKAHVNALLQQIPTLIAAGTMAHAYVAKFPKNLSHTLITLKQGGSGGMIRGAKGRFAGAASFYSLSTEAVLFGVFTAMSVASGQYFLSQINSEMKMMKLNLDKILEFLYGDKKAELMSEVSFVKYAYQNYNSIMAHEQQRIATISNLQEAKKVAMKDIEFYISDLDSTVNSEDNTKIVSLIDKAFQIKESLDLSMQLYGMSSILEVYYAQNHDSNYMQYIEGNMSVYVDKCEKRMLSSFSVLNRRISDYKGKLWEKIDKFAYEKQVVKIIESLNSGEESDIRKSLHSVLHASAQKSEYYITNDGNLYLKTS